MNLREWLDTYKGDDIARILKVKPRTIYKWKLLTTLPTPELMKRIYERSGRRVTYQTMIEDYLKATK